MAEEEKNEQVEEKEENNPSAADEKTEQDNGNSNMIPYDRFQQVIEEKNKYKNKFENLKSELENMDDPEKIKEKYNEEVEELSKKVQESKKEYALKTQAMKAGVAEDALDDFVQVADLSQLELNDDNVEGVEALVETMKEKKSYFFPSNEEKKNIGKQTNPANADNASEDEKNKLEEYFGIK